ncbi:agmatine deiminase family protein [Brevibacillus fluminis]|uniref:agmatine deiminase family protein n=1 Tax=Brevibacillus fluminis TaxID=511487 RepID=UPI001FE2EEF4|nr:agmatine deiminase family protein [Brevibacillus fluminis]
MMIKQFGFEDRDTVIELPAVSYLNFLITNKAVISAKYWVPGIPDSVRQKDEQAKQNSSSCLPGSGNRSDQSDCSQLEWRRYSLYHAATAGIGTISEMQDYGKKSIENER